MTIYPTVLYIKQHPITGLKYFGKTTAKDPLKYKGSGTDWKLHLKEYGSTHIITTIVFGPCTDSEVISEFALAFSRDDNIVESKDWANCKIENGLDGGVKGALSPKKGIPTGKPSPKKGKPSGKQQNPSGPYGPSGKQQNPSGPRGKRQNPAPKVECPHCGKIGGISAMKQWHFDNCKFNPLFLISSFQ
jgi:hypothetical protein